MHPAAVLLLWFAVVIAVQSLGYTGLLLCALALMVVPGVLIAWLGFVRRARWLLLTLWLILAYHTSGEAWADHAWAPTYEGLAEASLHAARLVLVLGCLGWLFVRLGREGLLAGLWGLVAPARRLGLDSERLVVRLSLVLERLQEPQERGAWRRVLSAGPDFTQGPEMLVLKQHDWRLRDSLLVTFGGVLMLAVLLK